MTAARQEQTWHTQAAEEPGEASMGSRRALLGGAAGGFALAASGLFLPATGEDAAARTGKHGGALGGRRGKNQRGRHRRRTHGDKKKDAQRNEARGSKAIFRNTALTLNILDGRVDYFRFNATFYYRVLSGGLDDYDGPWINSGVSWPANEHHLDYRFAPDRFRVGVLLSAQQGSYHAPDLFVDVRNIAFATPRAATYSGKDLDPAAGKLGEPVIRERDMDLMWVPFQGNQAKNVGMEYVLRNSPEAKATGSLIRNLDSDDFIEFQLSLAVI